MLPRRHVPDRYPRHQTDDLQHIFLLDCDDVMASPWPARMLWRLSRPNTFNLFSFSCIGGSSNVTAENSVTRLAGIFGAENSIILQRWPKAAHDIGAANGASSSLCSCIYFCRVRPGLLQARFCFQGGPQHRTAKHQLLRCNVEEPEVACRALELNDVGRLPCYRHGTVWAGPWGLRRDVVPSPAAECRCGSALSLSLDGRANITRPRGDTYCSMARVRATIASC
mmetsp:Transcript_31477/g.89345  ORF Transcript_31477/g.89345 Transcript_31477/m.89345 type:complete len:225 (+) Transcript_31477:1216-1890(+)